MSRARARKQQDTREFFAENPEAFDHDTQLSVVNNGGRFEVQAEGSKGAIRDYDDEELVDPLITLLSDLDTFEVDFNAHADPDPENPPFNLDPAFLSLTEQGFGILGETENVFKDEDEDELRNTAEDIRVGESLEVNFRNFPFLEVQEIEDGPEGSVFGGTAVNIDFMVLNNQPGTVQLFVNSGTPGGQDELITFDVGADSKGLQENVGFVMPDGEVFAGFDFEVTGDVRVSLTGIDFSSNYDGFIPVE